MEQTLPAVEGPLERQVRPQPDGHDELCKTVNETPLIASLLYDLNLLPEQTQRDPVRWVYTVAAVNHMLAALEVRPNVELSGRTRSA